MRCKVGDLAVVVRSVCGHEGKIVRCLRLSHWEGLLSPDGSVRRGPVWEVDQEFVCVDGSRHPFILDECLRPIRGNEGTDEILRIAGHPLSQSHRERADA